MLPTLQAPFPYFGSKRKVASQIWQRFGDTPNYVEAFAGSLAVLLARPHAEPGIETINDLDGLVVNFFRAIQADPDAVAHYADWPVAEADLHARHLWLVNQGRARVELLKTDPDFYDAKVAGWWVWGACCWIGGGWCSGNGPWTQQGRREDPPGPSEAPLPGVARQLPHLSSTGTGVLRKLPSLGENGRGIHRKIPHLSGAGSGVIRQMPSIGNTGGGVHAAGVMRRMPKIGSTGSGIHGNAAASGAGVQEWFWALSNRLRRVRMPCGDWSRVLGPSVTEKLGVTAVMLDAPYPSEEHCGRVYAEERDVAYEVRDWALAHGDNPLLRIALCGYESEKFTMPATWETFRWKASGGYGNQGDGRGRENSARETIWFSPHCLRPGLFNLFDTPEALEAEDDGTDPVESLA